MSNVKDLKKEFLEYLEIEKGRSLKTVENYDRYLKKFFDFSKITSPDKITDSNVREFRLWLNRQTGADGKGTLKRSEEHTSELQSQSNLVCRLLLEKKKQHETLSETTQHVTREHIHVEDVDSA